MNEWEIIGNSEALVQTLDKAKMVASSDASVLIYGESGTGKELLARFIYNSSKRKINHFVVINCSAIPDQLMENELFGHKKGAFTDASDDYAGKFGQANGGVIFLDEIGELSLQLQSKLLRVLQFKEYEQIGGAETLKTDVRIIAATNKNLINLIKTSRFREDLFYRLNVVPITLPPLRERKKDIILLAEYYLGIYNIKNNKNIKGFTGKVIELLMQYDWPGNIRELQNVIERAVVLSCDNLIDADHIALNQDEKGKNKNLKDAINDFKKQYIVEILEKNNWNQTKSAKTLDIQRTYLARLIKELNIDKF